jgi:hypothetical protein
MQKKRPAFREGRSSSIPNKVSVCTVQQGSALSFQDKVMMVLVVERSAHTEAKVVIIPVNARKFAQKAKKSTISA